MSGEKDTSSSNLAEAETETAPETGGGVGQAVKEPGATDAGAPEERADESPKPKKKRAAAAVDELEKQLKEARATVEAHWEAVLRGRAELENLRKRSERELENAHKYGLERIITELLPVKDSLELGLAAGDGEGEKIAKLREGMELTLKMFNTALEKFGVSEINPEGQTFDPEYHQAMTVQESEGMAPNSVISVIQKGYLLNDRLVRPALVIVAK